MPCRHVIVAALLAAAVLPPLTPALARPVAATAQIGTPGLGVDLTFRLNDHLNARVGANFFEYTQDIEMDDADIELSFRLRSFPLCLDYHPSTKSGFRLTAGMVINDNRGDLSADPAEPLVLDGFEFDIESFDGSMEFNSFCPYLGLGYGNAVAEDGRWHFSCNFGVMFHGTPDVDAKAKAENPLVQDLLNSKLADDVEDFEDDIAWWTFYPVVTLGFSVGF